MQMFENWEIHSLGVSFLLEMERNTEIQFRSQSRQRLRSRTDRTVPLDFEGSGKRWRRNSMGNLANSKLFLAVVCHANDRLKSSNQKNNAFWFSWKHFFAQVVSKVTPYVYLHDRISNLQHGAESCVEVYSVKFEERLIVTHKHGFGDGNGCWCSTTANILDSRHRRLCSVVKSRRTFEVSLSLSENFLNLLPYRRPCQGGLPCRSSEF